MDKSEGGYGFEMENKYGEGNEWEGVLIWRKGWRRSDFWRGGFTRLGFGCEGERKKMTKKENFLELKWARYLKRFRLPTLQREQHHAVA